MIDFDEIDVSICTHIACFNYIGFPTIYSCSGLNVDHIKENISPDSGPNVNGYVVFNTKNFSKDKIITLCYSILRSGGYVEPDPYDKFTKSCLWDHSEYGFHPYIHEEQDFYNNQRYTARICPIHKNKDEEVIKIWDDLVQYLIMYQK